MKKLIAISIVILLLMPGCTGNNQVEDGIITVDVTANYPDKELILQDFMDVEYIPLETNDEFICQDLVLDISENMILLRNHPGDGNIFIFDRNGKILRKINRIGQGAEEYTTYRRIVLDEDNAEIFVNDYPANRIQVYDLDGNFKRTLKQGDMIHFSYVYNFDRENLICNNNWKEDIQPFAVLSKQDGSVTREIQIPFKKKIPIYVEFELSGEYKGSYATQPDTYNPILPDFDSWILTEQSADTVYRYKPDHTMTPLIVRTPPVQSMNPEIFLFPSLFTGRYYFMDAVKKEFDESKYFSDYEGFPAVHLMYDKQEKSIFEYTVFNGDYTGKIPVKINKSVPVVNKEIVAWQSLEVQQLIEDYGNGKLKGRLKEIVAGLNEESNPVVMLIKHRK
jgi:hypothetical protein